jgi:hypothetical protein
MIEGDVEQIQAVDTDAEQADIRPGEDDPDGADHVPGDQQGHGQRHQAGGNAPAFFGHGQGNEDPQGNFDQQDQPREKGTGAQGVVQTVSVSISSNHSVPTNTALPGPKMSWME